MIYTEEVIICNALLKNVLLGSKNKGQTSGNRRSSANTSVNVSGWSIEFRTFSFIAT